MLERDFQAALIHDLKVMFPGCIIVKTDLQGFPDRIVLWGSRWAALEVKKSAHAIHQPNQDEYVDRLNVMSFASFIFPENRDEVLSDLQYTFRS